MHKTSFKTIVWTLVVALLLVPLSAPIDTLAAGATLSLTNPSETHLVKGCPSEIQILLDTGGESVLASDTTINSGVNATINSVSIGSVLPMQTFNKTAGNEIKLSGARFPATGGFSGNDTFGTISLTPSLNTNSVSLNFSNDLAIDNNVINDTIQNVLSSATGQSYVVFDRYNPEIDGGFCTSDSSAPTFSLVDPGANSTNNPLGSNVTLSINDNRSGVDIDTLQLTINGKAEADTTITGSGNAYLITVDPEEDFVRGTQVAVTVNEVCDLVGNCLQNQTKSFRTIPAASCGDGNLDPEEECDLGNDNHNFDQCTKACTIASCGDGYLHWSVEECDDGNNESGDGCTANCEQEPGIPTEPQEPLVCPELHEAAPETAYIDPNDVPEGEQIQTTAEAEEIIETGIVETDVEFSLEVEIGKCDMYSHDVDSDHDGISNKTECQIETNANRFDTDGDTCGDGAEINEYRTNPLIDDCKQSEKVGGEIIITDPQPGWTVSKIVINGTTPQNTIEVNVVAFPAEHNLLNNLVEEITAVITTGSNLTYLKRYLKEAQSFASGYSQYYEYSELNNILDDIAQAVDKPEVSYGELIKNLEVLQSLLKVNIYLGKYIPSPENDLTGSGALRFQLEPVDNLVAGDKLYDLVAMASLEGGGRISSVPIRISLDKDLNVNEPIPEAIDGQPIGQTFSLNNLFIEGAVASNGGIEIEIENNQPVITGNTEFGSQVFAVWESVVFASSVISDSEEGGFSIQAPRNLEEEEGHKVTLYSIKETDRGKLRSENVSVLFRIKSGTKVPYLWIGLTLLITVLALIASREIRRRLKKRKPKLLIKEEPITKDAKS